MSELEALIIERITAEGPLRFSEYMDLALYHPELGFYGAHGNAGGRDGDFVTSVETGPLFAAVIGEWLDRHWTGLGSPDPFHVVEGGAGVGTLWRGLRKASPACFGALHWHLVERSDRLRARHAELPEGQWSSLEALPENPVHVIVANELLDNLVFDIAINTDSGWKQQRVGIASSGGLELVTVDAASTQRFDSLGSTAPIGTRLPVLDGATDWLRHATALAGRVLVFDYGAPIDEVVTRNGAWLRTYRGHERGNDPLVGVGELDITCDIAPELLPDPSRVISQADWLNENGLPKLVDQARETWRERGQIGDLEAMFARSAMNEAAALTDPSGLGSFLVLEW